MSIFQGFRQTTGAKTRLELSAVQWSLIISLESVLQEAGLILLCPFCAGSAPCDGILQADNDTLDLRWKLDCDCTERRGSSRGVSPMPEGGDLVLLAADLLKSARLDIRCPQKTHQCRYTPLISRRMRDYVQTECPCRAIRLRPQTARSAANPS